LTEIRTAPLGDVSVLLNNRRQPLSKLERAKRFGPYPYYGAAGQLDSIDDFAFDGLHLLIGEDGTVVESSGCPMRQLVDGRFWVSNHAHVMRGAEESDTRFLYYALGSVDVAPHVTGSAQPKLSLGNLKKIKIPWPEISVRRAITEVLGALDDKIDSKRRVIEIANQYLSTCFHQFVSSPTTQSGRIGDLAANLKLKIGEVAEKAVVMSAVASSELVASDDFFSKRVYSKDIGKYLKVPRWAFAYNPSRINIGSIGLNSYDVIGAVSPVYVVAQSSSEVVARWLELALKTKAVREQIVAFSSGSVRQVLRYEDFASIELPIPESEAIEDFGVRVLPVYKLIRQAHVEILALSSLRDVLMPELFSGRLLTPAVSDPVDA
jgi:type I restriction enzyme S subunit